MRYIDRSDQFFSRIQQRFGAAVRDVERVADGLPGSPSDVRAVQVGPLEWRVGSSKPYAKAQERGAYIVPKRARALKFADGSFRMSARIKPKRYLAKAAAGFGRAVRRRMAG